MHTCIVCLKVYDKLEGNFDVRLNNRNGFDLKCKDCRKEYHRDYRRRLNEGFISREIKNYEVFNDKNIVESESISDEEAFNLLCAAHNISNKRQIFEKIKWKDLIYFK